MKDFTIVKCLICGAERGTNWTKKERIDHLLSHLDDVFHKEIVGADAESAAEFATSLDPNGDMERFLKWADVWEED